MVTLGLETSADGGRIEGLLDRCFGPERHLKTCQRLRDGQAPSDGLAFVMRDGRNVLATLRFWDLLIGGTHQALLLGPLAVDPDLQGEGIGSKMMRYGLNQAAQLGHGAVILVGDEPYYRRFGFESRFTRRMLLPGPVDRKRFLGLELRAWALSGARGLVAPARSLVHESSLLHTDPESSTVIRPATTTFEPSAA